MANFKRAKTKRRVKCTICTSHRWKGNHAGRFSHKNEFDKKEFERSARKGHSEVNECEIPKAPTKTSDLGSSLH